MAGVKTVIGNALPDNIHHAMSLQRCSRQWTIHQTNVLVGTKEVH